MASNAGVAIGFVALVVGLCGVGESFAAPSAGAKASGQFNFYGSSSRSALSGAREYAGNLRRYTEAVPSSGGTMDAGRAADGRGAGGMMGVSPIVSKEAVDAIEHGVAKSEKYLAVARRHAEAAADQDAVAVLDQINAHVADVKKCCRELAECCEMDAIDGKRSAACCKELEAALGKAIAAHDKLVPPAPAAVHGVMPAMPASPAMPAGAHHP